MVDDVDIDDSGRSGKSSRMKFIVIGVAVLFVLAGVVGGALFFTGFFDDAPSDQIAEGVIDGAAVEGDPNAVPGGPKSAPTPKAAAREVRKSPQEERFDQRYLELDRSFLANVSASRKVVQVSIAVMTHYDDRVFQNVTKHAFAIRSAVLDELRQITEPELTEADFRVKLAEKIRLRINEILERTEDFGGIEEVHFTEFIIQ